MYKSYISTNLYNKSIKITLIYFEEKARWSCFKNSWSRKFCQIYDKILSNWFSKFMLKVFSDCVQEAVKN